MIEFGDIFNSKGENVLDSHLPHELSLLIDEIKSEKSQKKVGKSKSYGETIPVHHLINIFLRLYPDTPSDTDTTSIKSEDIWEPLGLPTFRSALQPYRRPHTVNNYANENDSSFSNQNLLVNRYISSLCIFDLCYFSNPSMYAPPFHDLFPEMRSGFVDDITDALIFNLQYMQALPINCSEKFPLNPDKGTLYDEMLQCYNDNRAFCSTILPRELFSTSCYQYVQSVFLAHPMPKLHRTPKDQTTICNPFSAFCDLAKTEKAPSNDIDVRANYDKSRTFRSMWDSLSSESDVSPKAEDRWYLEKILGFNTVSALFPFYANNSRSRTEAQKISIKIINELMKCKPPRIRIYLAHIVSEAAINMSPSFEKRDKSSRNLYSSDFSKILIDPLAKAIELINSAYTSLLDLSYKLVRLCIIDPHDIFSKNDIPSAPSSALTDAIKHYGLSSAISSSNLNSLSVFYVPEYVESLLRYYSLPDPLRHDFAPSRDLIAPFAVLQSAAIKAILKSYDIPLPESPNYR